MILNARVRNNVKLPEPGQETCSAEIKYSGTCVLPGYGLALACQYNYQSTIYFRGLNLFGNLSFIKLSELMENFQKCESYRNIKISKIRKIEYENGC